METDRVFKATFQLFIIIENMCIKLEYSSKRKMWYSLKIFKDNVHESGRNIFLKSYSIQNLS